MVGGDLTIFDNSSLVDVDGLGALMSIGRFVNISDNEILCQEDVETLIATWNMNIEPNPTPVQAIGNAGSCAP